MLKIWYYPEGSLTEVEVGVTLAAAPIGNDSVAVTARWIDLLIAMRVWLILILSCICGGGNGCGCCK